MEQVQILQEERIQTETPEADLWCAVIERAIGDLSDPDLGEATLEWFASASDQPGTFRWICEHLDLNASAVWAALTQRESRKDPPSACASAPNKRRKPNEHQSLCEFALGSTVVHCRQTMSESVLVAWWAGFTAYACHNHRIAETALFCL